jgi:hypothetical protein
MVLQSADRLDHDQLIFIGIIKWIGLAMSAAVNAIILAHFDRPASINASHFKNFTQISMLRLNAKLVLLPVVVLADGRNLRQRPLFHKSQRCARCARWHSGRRISFKNAYLGVLSSDPARERDRQQQTDSKAMYFQL